MVARCKLRRAKPTSFSKYLPIYLAKTVTLQLPDTIYQRLVNTALGTRRSLEEVMLHALKVGSPPDWDNVPDEFKADLAALDRMEDEALWKIATARKTAADMARYDELLECSQSKALTQDEKLELIILRTEGDRFMLRKAQAAVLLRWQGHNVPAADLLCLPISLKAYGLKDKS